MLLARDRPFRDFEMTEPTSFMNCRLHRCPANAGEGRDLVDRQVAHAMVFYLAGNDAKDSALPFRVALPQSVRERARSPQYPAAVSRCFRSGRFRCETGAVSESGVGGIPVPNTRTSGRLVGGRRVHDVCTGRSRKILLQPI
jgi:hypothetical protein